MNENVFKPNLRGREEETKKRMSQKECSYLMPGLGCSGAPPAHWDEVQKLAEGKVPSANRFKPHPPDLRICHQEKCKCSFKESEVPFKSLQKEVSDRLPSERLRRIPEDFVNLKAFVAYLCLTERLGLSPDGWDKMKIVHIANDLVELKWL